MEVTMKIKQNTYFQEVDRVDVIINNNSSIELTIDKKYSVEYFKKNSWGKIELNFVVPDVLIKLPSNKSIELSLYLHPNQYHYGVGKYRIHKTVYLNNQEYNLYSEFTIR